MKYALVKTFWFFGRPIQKLYWFIFQPKLLGVKCIIENNGKFLLVKINYGHHRWIIPGGGVNKGESSIDAAIRETKEEVGLDVKDLVYIGSFFTNKDYKQNTVEIFLCKSDTLETKVDPIEIEEAKWFTRSEFPVHGRGSSFDKIFEIYDEFKSKTTS